MKTNRNIYKLRCENFEDEQFEDLVESDLMDIEDFLDSYVINKVDEQKIDSTIDILKSYMPKQEVQAIKEQTIFLERFKNNIDLVKFQFSLISKIYFISSLLLILVGTITTIKLNLSIYLSASIIAPIPILLGIFEIIKGRDENVWELELSYKYSLREIVLSRLIIINIVSILISIIISIGLKITYSEINLFKMISIWLIPIFLVGSISLAITSIYRSINSIALCIAIWILGVLSISIYEKIAVITNINTFIVLGVSVISVVIASKLFYKKSIYSIDYRTFDF
ncbi:hypothetical protein NSA24_06015 [Clostridioides mangenotii]|uniref:hypothetical protein n=1 Tax=Metaclostridioides mangenotii TaxID=1540 RepID=UPI00214A871A|nr:hypothetical protein [Clostridioides mangenotii]MCR1954390.1 hypothetical protein [Clostridioides mangenotii]